MIKEASKYGKVMVILNSDEWLFRKHGFVFMSFEERKYVMEMIKGVEYVVSVDDSDGTVCKALEEHRPDYFANGGDRKLDNVPEVEVCQRLGIEMLWGIGNSKFTSSSTLIREAAQKLYDMGKLETK